MVLPETIRAAVTEAVAKQDGPLLREAAASLKTSLDSGTRDRVSLKLLVLAAEAALQIGEVDVADWALNAYDVEARRYKSAATGDAPLAKVDPKDQYWCRCQFAKALLRAEYAHGLKGADLVKATLDAVHYLMAGMEVAQATPRYTFMCYNGSVHYWRVTRVLQRDGVRVHLLPSMEQIVKAVDAVPGQQEWKVQLKSNLALCLMEAGRAAEAQKMAEEAYVLAKEHVKPLASKMLCLKTHLGDAKTQLPADANSSTKARAMMQPLRTNPGATTEAQKTQILKDAWVLVDPGGPAGETVLGVDLEVVAEIGWLASLNNIVDIAQRCTTRAVRSQKLHPRVRAELTQHHRAVADLGPESERSTRCNLPQAYIDTCTRVVKKTGELLSSVLRLNDPELVQDTCLLIWNTGLVLLQLDLRPHVQQPFNQASNALEKIASPLHRLRVLFHLELAGCYIAEDVLITANKQVGKALDLDYVCTKEEQELSGYDRPLDYFLFPMRKVLALKTSIYDPPESPELQALLLIESAKEARTSKVKAECLNRAVAKLDPLPPIELPPDGAERARRHAAKARAVLWSDIVHVAAAAKLAPLVHSVVHNVLAPKWDPVNDKLMVLLQAEASLKDAEACMLMLQAEGEELVPLEPEEEGEHEPENEQPNEVDLLLLRACSGIVDTMKYAAEVKESWLVMNAAISAWNHYLHLVKEARYAELHPLLVPVFDELKKLEDADPALLCSVADVLACAWEHKFYLKHANPDVYSYKALLGSVTHEQGKGSEELQNAVEVCEAVMPRASEKDKRQLCATAARCKALLNGPPQIQDVDPRAMRKANKDAKKGADKPGGKGAKGKDKAQEEAKREPIAEAIGHIEILVQPQGAVETKRKAVNAALEALEAAGAVDVELWAKLSQGALAIADFANAIFAGKQCVSVLPPGFEEADLEELQPLQDKNLWYWMALAELVHGRGLLALVNPTVHALDVQDTMKKNAMVHFTNSAKFGVLAGARKDLVDAPVRAFWNASISFMGSSISRQVLLAPLRALMPLVRRVKVPSALDPAMVANMYVVLLEALGDSKQWEEGLRTVDQAFRSLPHKEHAKLWGLKVMFLCNSTGAPGAGNILDRMEAVTSYDAELQAKVWSMLAQQHPRRYEQFMAHVHAIDALSAQPWLQVDYMVDFADWLYRTGEPVEDVEDVLLCAADSILAIESPPEDDDGPASDGRSAKSYRSGLSKTSKSSKAASKAESRASKHKSIKSSSGTKRTSAVGKSKSGSSSRGDAGEQAKPPPAFLTVKHMRLGVRIFLMLSDISSTYAATLDYLMLAHHFGCRIIKGMLTEMVCPGSSMARPATALEDKLSRQSRRNSRPGSVASQASSKQGSAASERSGSRRSQRASSASSAASRERAKKELAEAEAKAKSKREAVEMDVPTTLEGWAVLELSDKAMEVISREGEGGLEEMGLNLDSIGRPELFLRYLFYMEHQLSSAGMHLHMLPVYQLAILVAQTVMKNEEVAKVVRLRLVCALEDLRLDELARANENLAGPIELTELELITTRAVRTQTLDVKNKMGMVVEDPGEASMAVPHLVPTQPQEVWLEKGKFLVRRREAGRARAFLEEALAHAVCLDDHQTRTEATILLAKTESACLNFERAVQLLLDAQQSMHDYSMFTDNLASLLEAKLSLPDGDAGAKMDLEAALKFLEEKMVHARAGGVLDAKMLMARLRLELSRIMLAQLLEARETGRDQAYLEGMYSDVLSTAQLAEAVIAEEGGPLLVSVQMNLGLVMAADPRPYADPRPHLRDVRWMLLKSQAEATRVLNAAQPKGMGSGVGLPIARQLGEVAKALSELNLTLAAANKALAAADLAASRPQFPANEAESEPPTAVEQFLDATTQAPPDVAMPPGEEAVLVAAKAANLAAAHEVSHVQFKCVLGRALASLHAVYAPEEALWGAPRSVPAPPAPEEPETDAGGAAAEHTPHEADAHALAAGKEPSAQAGEPGRRESQASSAPSHDATHPAPTPPAAVPGPPPPLPYLEQSMMVWKDAIERGLPREDFATVARAALDVAVRTGKQDEAVAAKHILLAQSCRVRIKLETVLCQGAGRQAREHLLLAQRRHFLNSMQMHPASEMVANNTATLAELSPAWPMLQVSAPVDKALEAIPEWTRVVSLHLSDDKSMLYLACVRNPLEGKPPADAKPKGGVDKKAPAVEGEEEEEELPCALVERVTLDPPRLSALLKQMLRYKVDMERFLSKEPEPDPSTKRRASVVSQEEPPPSPGPVSPAKGKSDSPKKGGSKKVDKDAADTKAEPEPALPAEIRKEHPPTLPKPVLKTALIEEGWASLMLAFEEMFADLQGTLLEAFKPLMIADAPPMQVLLLLDPLLAPLPWEALSVFKGAACVARDFSIHTMLHRLNAMHTRFPPDPKGGYVGGVNPSSFRYMVDLHSEDDGPPEPPAEGMPLVQFPFRSSKKMVDTIQVDFGQKTSYAKEWNGLVGEKNQVFGDGMLEGVMNTAEALLYFGMGRFLSYLGSQTVSRTKMSRCQLAVLMDQVRNSEVFKKQQLNDARRSRDEVQGEQPYETAALLSMRGVSTVVVNSLAVLADEHCCLLHNLFSALSEGGPVGPIVKQAAASRHNAVALLEKGRGESRGKSIPKKDAKSVEIPQIEGEESSLPRLVYMPYNTIVYGLPNLPVLPGRK